MAPFWDMLGQVSSVMQVTGVDAFGIGSMIVQAAQTAGRNKVLCQQLAQKVQIVSDLLGELQIPELRRHPRTRRALDELRKALFCAYMLVRYCSHQQDNRSQLYQMIRSDDMESKLRMAKEEIDGYIILIPMITVVAAIKARDSPEVQNDVADDSRTSQRPQLSCEEVEESVTIQELPPEEYVLELVLMIGHSAQTAYHNRDLCQLLAEHVQLVSEVQNQEMRLHLEQLENVLFRAYMLICFCSQYSRSQFNLMFAGADMGSIFRLAEEEINHCIDVIRVRTRFSST